jgi:YD repeat-containing protein
VRDEMPVIFSRTYRNRDFRSRPFGIGTNHSFGSFLAGDNKTFSYINLVLPSGTGIRYERTTPGTGFVGSAFVHTSSPSEYRDSRLYWNGNGFTVDLKDGSRYTFPSCNPRAGKVCTVSSYRDPQGRLIRMRHDRRMNMTRLETANGSAMEFLYDSADRIVEARTSNGERVTYDYDRQGRLVGVTSADGSKTLYTYDPNHNMMTIDEPGLSISNKYDRFGRCVAQDMVTTSLDERGNVVTSRSPFAFIYTLNSVGQVAQTEVVQPGRHRTVRFNASGYTVSDTTRSPSGAEIATTIDRDASSNIVQRMAVWCEQAGGTRVRKETTLDPEASSEQIERQLQLACASEALGR